MIVEVVPHSGMIVISDIIGDQLVTRRYIDYSMREAKKLFKQEMKDENSRGKTRLR